MTCGTYQDFNCWNRRVGQLCDGDVPRLERGKSFLLDGVAHGCVIFDGVESFKADLCGLRQAARYGCEFGGQGRLKKYGLQRGVVITP